MFLFLFPVMTPREDVSFENVCEHLVSDHEHLIVLKVNNVPFPLSG